MASPCEEGISKRDLRESINCYTYPTPLCHGGTFSLQDTNPFSSCSIPLSTFRDFICFLVIWCHFWCYRPKGPTTLEFAASGVRLVELAQQKSRVQLAKPKSFENLSPGVGSGWECLEILYCHSIKVMVLGLVESVRSLLPDFLSLEFVQGGRVFLYHSCKQKNTRLRTGIGLRCVLPGDLKIKVASAQHILHQRWLCRHSLGRKLEPDLCGGDCNVFFLLRINSSYFTMASECDVFTCSGNLHQKETMLAMGKKLLEN